MSPFCTPQVMEVRGLVQIDEFLDLQVGWFLGTRHIGDFKLDFFRWVFWIIFSWIFSFFFGKNWPDTMSNHQTFRWYLVKLSKGYFQGGNPHPQKDCRKKNGTGSEPSILGIPEMLGEGYVGVFHELHLRGDDVGQSTNGDASLDSRLSWHCHEAGIFLRIHFLWGGWKTSSLEIYHGNLTGSPPSNAMFPPQEIAGLMKELFTTNDPETKRPYLLGGGLALQGALRFPRNLW